MRPLQQLGSTSGPVRFSASRKGRTAAESAMARCTVGKLLAADPGGYTPGGRRQPVQC